MTALVTLSKLPSTANLLLRAALKRDRFSHFITSNDVLPATVLSYAPKQMNRLKIDAFHAVTQWNVPALHPCYLHVMSFPLHLMLMLDKGFPFSLLGLVHISNEIMQSRPISADEDCVFCCYFGNLKLHPKGYTFSIHTEVRVKNQLCWSSVSTYLYRRAHTGYQALLDKEAYAEPDSQTSPASEFVTANQADNGIREEKTVAIEQSWLLEPALGRQYARVSGDYNPIHLTKISARLFGFKRAIAHGMWSKSRCLSAIEHIETGIFSQAFETGVQFSKPALLPSNVIFLANLNKKIGCDEQGANKLHINFLLSGAGGDTPHLSGKLHTI